MTSRCTEIDSAAIDAIAFDHTKLLGYWLLPADHLNDLDDQKQSTHLKMGTKGGNKFFGGNAGLKRRPN